jgi:hypothetical protein
MSCEGQCLLSELEKQFDGKPFDGLMMGAACQYHIECMREDRKLVVSCWLELHSEVEKDSASLTYILLSCIFVIADGLCFDSLLHQFC